MPSDIPDLAAIRAAREAQGLQPDPGPPLGALFGASFSPQPFNYGAAKELAPNGHTEVVYLWIEHAHGRLCVAMDAAEAEQFGKHLVQKARGVVTVRTPPPATNP